MRTHIRILALLLAVLVAGPAFGQSLVGSVAGTIKDEQGGALPGASVTLTGKTGNRAATSEADGTFRFVGVDPGSYTLQAQLTGFQTQKQNVSVNVGKEVSADFSLKVGGMSETLEVVGDAPVVNVTSSATDNALSQDLLFNLPIRPTNAAVQLLNYAPGINNGSAYGADGDTANGLLIDGVDTRDPEGGSAWTFFNYNIVEEVQIQGLGAPAEYGAFTGAVVNTITRSGGNQWAGLFDVIYSNADLTSNNITDAVKTENPALKDPAVTNKLLDFTTQLSGPLIQDKLFFFASAQRYKLKQDPSGPRTIRDEVSPRLNLKLNYQPGPSDFFQGTFQADDYNVIGRPPGGLDLVVDDTVTNREDAPEFVWLAQWRHVFGSKTYTEVKYTGWTGYFDLNPEVNAPGHSDNNGAYYTSQGWFAYYDRGRHQVNATLSHYAEGFGKHDLKFGVEIERSKVRNRYGYVDDIIFYDYDGAPYTAYSYSYDLDGRNQRESFFAQDSWKVNDRLTLNPGVRFDWVRGTAPQLNNEKVYDTKNLAPRFGFAFDLTGDRKTVLKGSYSRYYEGAFFLTYSGAVPGIGDYVTFDASACPSITNCPKSALVEVDRTPAKLYTVDPDIKHPLVDEFTVGMERALTRDIRLSVTGISRKDKNLQGSVIPSARWAPVTVSNGLTGQPLTVYRWTNPDASESDLFITNPDGFQYLDANGNVLGTARAFRKYRGLMFVLDKRLANRWLGRVSYVLSKAEGSVENDGFDSYGVSSNFESPSRALVNAEGPMRNDRRHEFKLMLGVQVPVVEVSLNGYFRSVSGRTYTPFQQFGSSVINFVSGGRRARLEPRGSRRLDTVNILDLRLEKIFKFGGRKDRIALYADLSNALNSGLISSVIDRYPTQAIAGAGDVPFGAPSQVTAPRQTQLGVRWSF
jgi:hypothetical protein